MYHYFEIFCEEKFETQPYNNESIWKIENKKKKQLETKIKNKHGGEKSDCTHIAILFNWLKLWILNITYMFLWFFFLVIL